MQSSVITVLTLLCLTLKLSYLFNLQKKLMKFLHVTFNLVIVIMLICILYIVYALYTHLI